MFKGKVLALGMVAILAVSFVGCGSDSKESTEKVGEKKTTSEKAEGSEKTETKKAGYTGKKVLYVDSYKDDYPWSKSLMDFAKGVLDPQGVEVKVVHMDTKNNTAEDYKVKAGEDVKKVFDEFKPDVVITADDNAVKYFAMKYLKDAETPIVSLGVNWNGSSYGFPYKNSTGLYEVPPVKQTVEQLKKVSKGSKMGFISSDTDTSRKDAEFIKQVFSYNFEKVYFPKDYEEFMTNYKALQTECDMILLNNTSGIKGWDPVKGKEFIYANTKIPTGTTYEWVTPFALLGVTTVAKEHGETAANTALKILDGKKPSELPFEDNKEGSIYLNQTLAQKLSVTFDADLLKTATKVIRD